MSFNLLDTVNGLFTSNIVSRAASALGETEGSIQKAIHAVVPSVLTGLLNKAGSGGVSPVNILNMSREASGSGVLGNLGSLLGGGGDGGGKIGLLNMASNLFGDRLGNISSMISGFAGIKSSSAASLVNIATPASLGVIGNYASENNLNAGGILRVLASQKDKILAAIPAGLGLANALGLSSLNNIGTKLSGAITGSTGEVKKRAGWLPAAILIALAAGLLWYLLRSRDKPPVKETTVAVAPAGTEPLPVSEASVKVKLPDGSTLDAFKGGVEDKLVAFLNDPNAQAGKDIWFDFDNLNFETGSATITAGSQQQVNNIAAILKAYPNVKIKIGGYTDKTGDAAANKKLSQDRADAVVAALQAAGSNTSQLAGAEGYGSAFATVAADASEEARKADRRIAVSVREK